MPNNPYVAGNPVGKTQAFTGREDVLREVMRVIKSPSQNAIALYGQRRIGKTSILQYLAMYLPQEGAYKPVYFDLQDKAAMPLARVIEELTRTIALAYGFPAPNLGEDTETAFRSKWLPELIERLTEKEKLVLLFDEFDILANPKGDQATRAFFPYLRNLLELDLKHLKFIFVLGRSIDDLDSIALSVFKGILSSRVSLLTRKDTELLARIAERNKTLHWTDGALTYLWELTHGHPYLTQHLCSQIWDELYTDDPKTIPEVRQEHVEDLVQKTLDASRNALEWVWNGLPPAERVVISALAEAGAGTISQERLKEVLHNSGVRVLIRELRDAPALLSEWDLIESDNSGGSYTFRVELLRRWLVANKPLRRVQEELDRLTPVADGFYQAAQGIFAQGDLESAAGLLRQAVAQNPNHLRANELLSEILITQNEWDEARKLLEHLYEINPSVARPRLAQVLVVQADEIQDEVERLKMYDRILELEPRRYESLREQADEMRFALRARELASSLTRLSQLQKDKKYDEARILAENLATEFPEQQNWKELLHSIDQQFRLSELYQRALGALNSDDIVTARRLFAEVVGLDPEYEQASNYLHKAVSGTDATELQAKYDHETNNHTLIRRRMSSVIIIGILILIGWAITGWRYISKEAEFNALSTLAAPLIASTQTALVEINLPDIGEILQEFQVLGHTRGVKSVAFSPDGQMLVSGSYDNNVILWNVSDGTLIGTLEGQGGHTNGVTSVAFSPDGQTLASGSYDKTIILWNVSDGRRIRTLEGHTGGVTSVAFSPDGQTLASGSYDKTVILWNASDGRRIRTLEGHTGGVTSVAFSPDSQTLASGTSEIILLWNIGDARRIGTLEGHTNGVTSVAFSPDGQTLASGSNDKTVILWNVSDGRRIRTLEGHTGGVTSVAFSPDGQTLASGFNDKTVILWNVSNGEQALKLDTFKSLIRSVAFSPDGTMLATGSGSLDQAVLTLRVK